MPESDIVHVIVGPLDVLEANSVEEIASIIKKDVYSTRLSLAGKIPRIIAQYKSAAEAEAVVQSIEGLGLVVFSCPDRELRKPASAHFKATGLKVEAEKRVFRDETGAEKVLPEQSF